MNMISENDRIHKRYSTYERPEIDLNSEMFIEDFGKAVVPTYKLRAKSVFCIIYPDNEETKVALSELLPSAYLVYRPTFDQLILGTIEYFSQRLANHGFIVFEIVKNKQIDGREFYRLEHIFGKEVKIKKDKIIQVFPKDVKKQLGISQIEIPIEKCIIIEFPKSLGGVEKYNLFLKELKELSKLSPMGNFMKNPLQEQPNYDLVEHQRLHDIELWKKTKVYNWPHRSRNKEMVSEFYYSYRQLLFQRNKIKLRDYIINRLSEIISSQSEKLLGQKIDLRIEGLLKIEILDEKIEQWKSGQIDFKAIWDIL